MFVVFFAFSCTDQGCIDADDFGEYQTQVLEIESNASESSCFYNSALDIFDASQGSGVKTCLTSGAKSITDEAGVVQNTSSQGCGQKNSDGTYVLDAVHFSLCTNGCVQSCLNGSSQTGGVASAEPNWKSTNKRSGSSNYGIQILPGSQITINAVGNVTLSNSANYDNIYIPVDSLQNGVNQNFKDSSWSQEAFFDVSAGQSINSSFSGKWVRTGSGTLTSNYYDSEFIGSCQSAAGCDEILSSNIAAATLVAYTIPHPAGYSFDSSATTEKSGTKGVPLLPDTQAWTCSYQPNSALTRGSKIENNCANKTNAYLNLGYDAAVDEAVAGNELFSQIAYISNVKAPGLGIYGGMIRHQNDYLHNSSYDPWSHFSGYDQNYPFTNDASGAIVSTSTPTIIANNFSYPIAITFLTAGHENVICGDQGFFLNAVVNNSDSTIARSNIQIPIVSSSNYNNTNSITLETGQSISITTPTNTIAPNKTCANQSMAWKISRYLDIEIERSGFVRFTNLNASGNCTINARIINPKNPDNSNKKGNETDFFEHDDFSNSSSNDPLNSLSVPSSSLTMNWSNMAFVRKGQIIRFSPASWNGNITVNTTDSSTDIRQCGIGMAMQILPRPALICKGVAEVAVDNPDPRCQPDYSSTTGDLLGCKAYASECLDSSNTAYYCPYDDCKSTISCTSGNSSNLFTKSSCTSTDNSNSGSCNSALSSLTPSSQTDFKTSCGPTRCSAKMLENAQLPAKIAKKIDQCYDLENYTGKLADIEATTSGVLASDNAIFSKGATRINVFNGYYGNFTNFAQSEEILNSNKVYQSRALMTFAENSRLKFIFLNNDKDFKNLATNYSSSKNSSSSYPYSANSSRGSNYNGSNGFRIGFDGTLQFSNGKWMEVRLCREDSSASCQAISISAISSQPRIIEINDPTSSSASEPIFNSSTNYRFDAFGTLIRTTAPASNDCSISGQAVDTQINSPFYCHTYISDSKTYTYDSSKTEAFSKSDYDEIDKLRLSFKIKDPETTTCNILCQRSDSKTLNGYYSSIDGDCLSSDPAGFNGILIKNPAYQSSFCATSLDNQTCAIGDGPTTLTPPSGVDPCCKQYYCASPYSNNNGKYTVSVKVANPAGSNISNIIGGVIEPIVEIMDGKRTLNSDGSVTQTVGQAERIYTLVVSDSRYQAILSMSLALMIMFYGVTYLMGITEMNSSDLINRAIKIGLIYLFASPNGWYWFNTFAVKWFKDGTDYLSFIMASSFDTSPALQKAISLNEYYDKSVLFSSVDKVFGMFFSPVVQKKISALLFASIFGIIYLWIIYLAFFLYVYAVGYAVLYYLTAQIFISILFTLGPIFFIFTLFNQTKGMFDAWLQQLIGFSLQQIFLLTTLAFFNMMMYEVLKMSLGYKICWDEVWTINIITRISLLSFWTPASLPPRLNTQTQVGDIGHPEGIPSLFSILFIWVIASLMKNFIQFMTNLGASIGGSLSASAMADGALKTIQQAQKYSSDRLNDIKKGVVGEPLKRMDKFLFDSGEYAEKDRKERQQKNRETQLKKTSLDKAGDKAMSDYKREHAAEFSKMTEDQKKSALSNAREDGMKKEAKKLGISDEELKALKEDKGLKYEGYNVLVGAGQALRQKAGFGGGTLDKSLNDKTIDTKMSFSDSKAAMKKMSSEERKDFVESAKKGEVSVDKSTSQKLASGVTNAAKGVGAVPAAALSSVAAATAGALGGIATAGAAAVDYAKGDKNFSNAKKVASLTSSAVSFAAKPAVSVGAAVGSAKDSIKSAASKVMGQAANAAGFGEYNEARKQLEESGDLRKVASNSVIGANWARPNEEKKQIHDKMMKNREEKSAQSPVVNDAVTIAKLDSERKGLDKDESKSGIVTDISSAAFGSGGLSRAVAAQGEKLSATNSVDSVKAAGDQINNQLAEVENQKSAPTIKRDAAQKAASDIKQVQKLEQEQKESGVDNSKQIEDVKGNSEFYRDEKEMSEKRAKYESSTDESEKKNLSAEMSAISSKDSYIESKGGGLNNANKAYQKADQQLQNLDKKSEKLKSASKSFSASKETFDKAMSSPKAEEASRAKESYDKLSLVKKAGFGRSEDDKKVVENYKKHQPTLKKMDQMKKDFTKLGDLKSEKDMEVKTNSSGEKTSRLEDAHYQFAKKHKDVLDEN